MPPGGDQREGRGYLDRRRGEAGQQHVDEPANGDEQARDLQRPQALAGRQAPRQHRRLHRAEQQQRAGRRRELAVGEGEGGGIAEQAQAAAVQLPPPVSPALLGARARSAPG